MAPNGVEVDDYAYIKWIALFSFVQKVLVEDFKKYDKDLQ